MAMVPAAGAMQQQLGDDDERQAKQLALQRDAETRLGCPRWLIVWGSKSGERALCVCGLQSGARGIMYLS